MRFYYLHLFSFDGSYEEPFVEQPEKGIASFGLRFDSWQRDDMTCFEHGRFFISERLRSLLEYKKFSNLNFYKINRLVKGGGFLDKYPDSTLPQFYWYLEIGGVAGIDDFGLINHHDLVVSQKALDFLRDNHVTHAESDEINTPTLQAYFDSPKKYFWMDEPIRQYFIQMDEKKKNI